MPVDLGGVITQMASSSVGFAGDIITDYWPYILGLAILGLLASRFKRIVGLAR